MADDTEFEPDEIHTLIEWLRGDIRKRSPCELQARRTLARMLRSERPLDIGLRFILADAVDPDGEGAQRLFLKRKPGRRSRINQRHIAAFVYRRTQAGLPWEAAVHEAMDNFHVGRTTVTGAWSKWRRDIERHPEILARI